MEQITGISELASETEKMFCEEKEGNVVMGTEATKSAGWYHRGVGDHEDESRRCDLLASVNFQWEKRFDLTSVINEIRQCLSNFKIYQLQKKKKSSNS